LIRGGGIGVTFRSASLSVKSRQANWSGNWWPGESNGNTQEKRGRSKWVMRMGFSRGRGKKKLSNG